MKQICRKHRKGFTLIEVMTVCVLMVFLTTILFNFLIGSARYTERITTGQGVMNKLRQASQKMSTDVSESEAILMQYPTTGSPTYRTSYNDTVILRVPKFDSLGNQSPTDYDVVIYKLMPTVAGARTGPFTFNKYKASVTLSNQPVPTLQSVVATNIESVDFNYITNETFTGDESSKVFSLAGTPLLATSQRPRTVLVGSVDRLADGKATLSGSTVTFAPLAPSWGVSIDVTYAINPASAGGTEARTPAQIFSYEFTTNVKSKVNNQVDKTTRQVFTGRAKLLNQ